MQPKLVIRVATAEDEAGVRAFLEGLSEDTLRLRYATGVPKVRAWMVDAVVRADHAMHEALIAIHEGRIVGVAEWGRWEPGDEKADIAVVVRDDCRRNGIARALIRRLARNARSHGIETFAGTILSTNRASIALLQDVAPMKTVELSGATFDVTIPLTATA
jgi:L-amino acid N-acyltransferase YncA